MGFKEIFSQRVKLQAVKLVKAFEDRHFEAYFCETKEAALKKALELIPAKSVVSWGGSETIEEIGLLDAVKKGDYKVIDRDSTKDKEERVNLMRQALLSDTFLMSTNAITQDGQLVNIDGFGNRVSALIFGPKSVIVIVGMHKVCKNVTDAISRVRNYVAPLNVARIGLKTPCGITGECADCKGSDSVCSHIVTTRISKIPKRIKIILVGEQVGY